MQDTGIGYRHPAPGTGYRIPSTWPGPTPRTQHRAPKTEPGDRVTENAHIGYTRCRIGRVRILATWYLAPVFEKRAHRVCILYPYVPRVRVSRGQVPGIGYRLSGTWDLVPGTGAESTPKTGHRAPRTEPGHRKTRTPGIRVSSVAIRQCGNTGN